MKTKKSKLKIEKKMKELRSGGDRDCGSKIKITHAVCLWKINPIYILIITYPYLICCPYM